LHFVGARLLAVSQVVAGSSSSNRRERESSIRGDNSRLVFRLSNGYIVCNRVCMGADGGVGPLGGAEMDALKKLGVLVLVAVCLPLILVCVAIYLLWRLIWGAILWVWFWRAHAAHGRPVLFIYSESPNWQAYIEANILPRIGDRAVVLNWSQREQWLAESPWEARFYRRFAGDREFNPLALVFGRSGRVKAVRFHQAFLDFKHGKESTLRAAEAELFSLLEIAE
jgi:hypothetical protein